MAHIGRDYKLWFRRDFSVSQPNTRNGYPESWQVQMHGWKSIVYPQPVSFNFHARNDQKGPGDTRQWTFDQIAGSGLHTAGLLEVLNPPIDGFFDLRVTITTAELGDIWIGHYKNTGPAHAYDQFDKFNANDVPLNTPFLNSLDTFASIILTPWDWSAGP
jgi:hypothetical protein